jgi:hypothetical protein
MGVNPATWPPAGKLAVVLVVGAMLAACGGSASPGAASSTARSSAAVAVNPTDACLKLHDWQLHNTGQGISQSLASQLTAGTRGTQLGTDITQWLQDLNAPVPSGSGSASDAANRISQITSDAAAVGTDCESYGVRNTLPDGSSP